MELSKDKATAILQVVKAIEETIVDLGEVPAGHLYAHMMGIMSLDTFNALVGILKDAGKVTEDAMHVLRPANN